MLGLGMRLSKIIRGYWVESTSFPGLFPWRWEGRENDVNMSRHEIEWQDVFMPNFASFATYISAIQLYEKGQHWSKNNIITVWKLPGTTQKYPLGIIRRIIKTTISSIVIGLKVSCSLLIDFPSCYRIVCYETVQ